MRAAVGAYSASTPGFSRDRKTVTISDDSGIRQSSAIEEFASRRFGMSKVLYSASISLDGFMAGPGGDMSWLTPFMDMDVPVDTLQSRVGSLLVGARTFRGDDPNAGTEQAGAYAGAWHGPSFVVTRHPEPMPVPDTVFVPDVETGLEQARAAAGDGYVSVLGADIARQCLELGQLDEVLAYVLPVFLGDGTPFFRSAGGRQVTFEPISVAAGTAATAMWLRVVR